ncbi:MAG: prephenate dehydrogenase, partial [Pseudonocardiaceae bacterium]
LGAGSFTDGTRVAGSPPDLVRAMCEGNRSALLTAVDDALGRLGAARGSLASTGGLAATIRTGHLARRAFDAARGSADADTVQIDLDAPGALDQLREIGRAGGRVVALDGTRCGCVL